MFDADKNSSALLSIPSGVIPHEMGNPPPIRLVHCVVSRHTHTENRSRSKKRETRKRREDYTSILLPQIGQLHTPPSYSFPILGLLPSTPPPNTLRRASSGGSQRAIKLQEMNNKFPASKSIVTKKEKRKKSEKEDPIHEDNKMAKARPGSVRSMLSGDDISIARAFHGQ